MFRRAWIDAVYAGKSVGDTLDSGATSNREICMCYRSFPPPMPLGPHWDGHDVLILQVHGRKLWKVYPMTREHPIQGDPKDEKPPEEPVWEGMLESGDLLYIPRGWWHVAVPVDEPTLHLTVGLHRPTGLDFVSWYAERLRSQAVVRENLPAIGTESDKAAHLERLREAWEQFWKPALRDEFCDYLDSHVR